LYYPERYAAAEGQVEFYTCEFRRFEAIELKFKARKPLDDNRYLCGTACLNELHYAYGRLLGFYRLTPTNVQQRHTGIVVRDNTRLSSPGVNMDVLIALCTGRQRRAHKHVVQGLSVHVKETVSRVMTD